MDFPLTGQAPRTSESRFQALSLPEALPSARDENYRFAGLKSLILDRTLTTSSVRTALPPALRDCDEGESAVLVLESASARVALSGRLGDGISLSAQTERQVPEAFQNDVFAQLASARARGVVRMEVTGRHSQSLRLLRYLNSESAAQLDHVAVTLAPNSRLSLVDELCGAGLVNGKNPLSVGLLEISVGENAELDLHQIQSLGPAVDAFQRIALTLEAGARVTWQGASLGGAKTQLRLDCALAGRGATFLSRGACRGDGEQHFDFWITTRHLAPGTESDIVYRNVMADASRAVFNGNIVIPRTSPQTAASQRNFNMLLSKRAHVATVPKLEIAVDDVKCAHGATVSPVSEDQLFYLESRGISRPEALAMIIDGFTRPVIDAFPTPRLRERVEAGLVHKHRGEAV